jgi:hypothetical protein
VLNDFEQKNDASVGRRGWRGIVQVPPRHGSRAWSEIEAEPTSTSGFYTRAHWSVPSSHVRDDIRWRSRK